jgi:hypothetical protein
MLRLNAAQRNNAIGQLEAGESDSCTQDLQCVTEHNIWTLGQIPTEWINGEPVTSQVQDDQE